jgi:hypothetical protein
MVEAAHDFKIQKWERVEALLRLKSVHSAVCRVGISTQALEECAVVALASWL